jgi:hypothetical protein
MIRQDTLPLLRSTGADRLDSKPRNIENKTRPIHTSSDIRMRRPSKQVRISGSRLLKDIA